MADFSILEIELKGTNGETTYVNPAHIVKVVRKNDPNTSIYLSKSQVYLTNGDVFEVGYLDSNKIIEYFKNAQKKLM